MTDCYDFNPHQSGINSLRGAIDRERGAGSLDVII